MHWEELRNYRRLVLIATEELAAKEDVTHKAILAPLDAGPATFGEGPAIRRQWMTQKSPSIEAIHTVGYFASPHGHDGRPDICWEVAHPQLGPHVHTGSSSW